ncbi:MULTISPECIES: Gfo/Idh/MocA family protein [Haloarcula]|nr:Gfo/Idh/MocA family oxidoreductase [Halomicroarcula sp. XH51]
MLKIGVIGCGYASKNYHFPVIEAIDEVELAWVADVDADSARTIGSKYGVEWYTDPETAVEATPDVVHVNTPPFTHADLTVSALRAGAHVLVEKPMAMTEGECESMISVAEETGQKLSVVHNNLFFDPMEEVLDDVYAGEYGTIHSVRSFIGGAPNPDDIPGKDRSWVDESHGGPIGDRLPHPTYLVTHFFDDVSDPCVNVDLTDDGTLMGASVQVADGDRFGSIHVTERALPGKSIIITGSEKMAVVDLFNYSAVTYDTLDRSPFSMVLDNFGAAGQLTKGTVENAIDYARDVTSEGSKYPAPGHYNLIRRFVASIESDTPVPIDPSEGVKVVRVLDQIDRQARAQSETGQRAADEPS